MSGTKTIRRAQTDVLGPQADSRRPIAATPGAIGLTQSLSAGQVQPDDSRLQRSSSSKLSEGDSQSIKVCVRVRPMNDRELGLEVLAGGRGPSHVCVRMPSALEVRLEDAQGTQYEFGSDRAYWSVNPKDANFASQEAVAEELGNQLAQNVLAGYHSCLFAYGQTGSGKTYCVNGGVGPGERGLLPFVVEELFSAIEDMKCDVGSLNTFNTHVSFMELYQEQFRDLLATPNQVQKKVDVHFNPRMGVFVQGLIEVPVFEPREVLRLIDFGSKARTVGATCMNNQSSRSHAIFILELCKTSVLATGEETLSRAKLSIVDLAGSERQKKAQSTGVTTKEGSMINQSLTMLALVIHTLADLGHKKSSHDFVPFRNSKLTFVLQDSLSGNSKTVLLAAISPALDNFDESLSTMRFTESVKKVKMSSRADVVVTARGDFDTELERLRRLVEHGQLQHQKDLETMTTLKAKYESDEESQRQLASDLLEERQRTLRALGLSVEDLGDDHVVARPRLVNLSDDPSLCGCLAFFIFQDQPMTLGADASANRIPLSGLGVRPQMAVVRNVDDVVVTLERLDGRVVVNGRQIIGEVQLAHGDRLIVGFSHCFSVVVPLSVRATSGDEAIFIHSLQDALHEVIPHDSETYERCTAYIEDLEKRIGRTRAEAFLQVFRRLHGRVEEANTISLEVRPLDRLHFVIEVVLGNVFCPDSDLDPECVVRLRRWETGARRWRNVVRRKLRAPSSNSTAIGARSGSSGASEVKFKLSSSQTLEGFVVTEHQPFETVMIFDARGFEQRLQILREVYHVFCQGGLAELDFSLPGADPWREITLHDDVTLHGQHRHDAELLRATLTHKEREFTAILGESEGRGLDLEAQLEASKRKVRDLEAQVAAAKAACSSTSALMRLDARAPRSDVVGTSNGNVQDLLQRLKRTAGEGEVTQAKAAQLLERMRSMSPSQRSAATTPRVGQSPRDTPTQSYRGIRTPAHGQSPRGTPTSSTTALRHTSSREFLRTSSSRGALSPLPGYRGIRS